MSERIICSWFLQPAEERQSLAGNVSMAEGLDQYNHCYWRCIYNFYATARKSNPTVRLLFFTNLTADKLPHTEVDFATFFIQQRVEVISLPFTYSPPKNFYIKFMAVFYMLDVLNYLVVKYAQQLVKVLLFDSDVLFLRSAAELWELLDQADFLAMDMNHYRRGVPQPKDSCGLTSYMGELAYPELADIYQHLYHGVPPEDIPIYGGECFGFNQNFLRRMADNNFLPTVFDLTLARRRQGLGTLVTDEPFFSMLALGSSCALLNPFMRRIEDRYCRRNIYRKNDLGLIFWHVPREKNDALLQVFNFIRRNQERWQALAAADWPPCLATVTRRHPGLRCRHSWSLLKTLFRRYCPWFYRLLKPLHRRWQQRHQ